MEKGKAFIVGWLAAASTKPTNETVSADTRSFELGWNFKWPEATGPSWNMASAITTLTQAPTSVTAGSSATFAASVAGKWDTTGYGIERDHTISLAGVAGTNQFSNVGDPSSVQSGQFGVTNTITVPAAVGGEIGLVLNVGLRFGGD